MPILLTDRIYNEDPFTTFTAASVHVLTGSHVIPSASRPLIDFITSGSHLYVEINLTINYFNINSLLLNVFYFVCMLYDPNKQILHLK